MSATSDRFREALVKYKGMENSIWGVRLTFVIDGPWEVVHNPKTEEFVSRLFLELLRKYLLLELMKGKKWEDVDAHGFFHESKFLKEARTIVAAIKLECWADLDYKFLYQLPFPTNLPTTLGEEVTEKLRMACEKAVRELGTLLHLRSAAWTWRGARIEIPLA
jgi:hypothetical protein